MRVRANTRRVVTFLAVSLLVFSLVAPIAAASTASASTSSPSGMVGVPAENLGPTPDGFPAVDEWDVMADRHADSLELEIAKQDGEPMLLATDDEHSEGRTVAVDRATLAVAVGNEPRRIHGENDEGEDWSAQMRYSGDYALLDIPHFSTNEITFDGTVSISADPADDGSTFQYDLDSAESIGEIATVFEGVEKSRSGSESGTVNAGESIDTNIGGNLAPVGPSGSGSPEMTVSKVDGGTVGQELEIPDMGPGGSATDQIEGDGIIHHLSTEASVGNLDCDDGASATVDVYISDNGNDVFAGDPVGSMDYSMNSGHCGGTLPKSTDIEETQTTGGEFTIGFEVASSTGIEDVGYPNGVNNQHSMDTYEKIDFEVSDGMNEPVEFVGPDVGTKEIDIEPGADPEVTGNGTADWSLEYEERSVTEDPTVTVNGESVSYDGVLEADETAEVTVDDNWIADGTNDVEVTTIDGSGFAPSVGFEFSHSAAMDQTVDYSGETWSERYSMSRTWDDATGDASVTIPFSSDRVVAIRDVETRRDGGSWSELSSDDYTLDGTTLEAQLGDVDANEQVDVRATGSKVAVENGAIDVLEPTVEGNTIDTAVEIADYSDGFGIDIGNTSEANWIHKTANESWTAPETFVSVDADGGQTLHAPGASAGGTMHVRTTPLEVNPNAGSVDVQLLESDREAKFDVDPSSSASEVEYRWHDTVSGDDYVLYSETHGVARASATASSPVSLVAQSYDETLSIIHDVESTNGSSPAGGGGGGFGGAVASTAGGVSPLLVLGLGVVGLAGTALVARRMDLPMTVVAGVGLLTGILGLETISPGTITDGVRSALVLLSSDISPIMPLVILIVVGALAYGFVRWLQARAGPDTAVTLDLGSRRK